MRLYQIRASYHRPGSGEESYISHQVYRTRREAESFVEPFRRRLCDPAENPVPCDPARTTAWVIDLELYDAGDPGAN